MHYLRTTNILTLIAIANALSTPPRECNGTQSATGMGRRGGRTHLSAATLAACATAHNCETYEHPVLGTHIRFVDGMGPGSEHYARASVARRDGERNTKVSVGDNVLNYGSAKASGPDGVIHHLFDVCGDTACDTSPVTVSSNFADQTAPWKGDLVLTADGQFANAQERDAFVGALVELAAHGESCWTQKWSHGQYGGAASSGSVDMCKQSNFLNVNRWSAEGNLQGFISVRVELKETEGNWCDTLLGVLGDVTGILAAIPGLEPVGGAASFFGLASVACEM